VIPRCVQQPKATSRKRGSLTSINAKGTVSGNNFSGIMADQIILPQHRSKRLAREWKTISAMLRLYCRRHHHAREKLCAECESMLEYARARLDRCRFGAEKPACAKCPVHCYSHERRERIKEVMRYAGPRMLLSHPILSLCHLLDSRRS
jgi:hypothetical protein